MLAATGLMEPPRLATTSYQQSQGRRRTYYFRAPKASAYVTPVLSRRRLGALRVQHLPSHLTVIGIERAHCI